MKRIFFILLFVGNIVSSQTKQETIDWINLKLSEHTDSWFGNYSVNTYLYENSEYLVIKAIGLLDNPNRIQLYIIDPQDVNSISVTNAFRTDGKLGLKILCKEYTYSIDGQSVQKFEEPVKIYCTPAPDETIIRLKKGLIHLLNLMGKKIVEPKELFKD